MEFSSVNTIWVLVGAALVFFMQAGFAMVETGFTRAKNAGNIIMKNLMDFAIGTPLYWLLGFGIMFGGSGALIGGFDPMVLGSPSCLSDFPDRLLCNSSYHRIRCHGRADQIYFLLYLQCSHQCFYLSHLRPLDLGRRLAGSAWLP